MSSTTTLGSRISQARESQGLTTSQLARRLGVKPQTLENWEQNKSEPRAEKLNRIAGLTQVPLTWLLAPESYDESESPVAITQLETLSLKLDRAISMQQELAALLIDISADLSRLERQS